MSAEPTSLAALYVEHGLRLRRFVFAVLHDRAAAEDVVQATFAKAAQAGEGVEPAALKSWLYRVAFNEAISYRRRRNADRNAKDQIWNARQDSSGEEPQEMLVRMEATRQVREAVQRLSSNQQQVLRARIYEDKKFVQIAADLGIPLATVLTHMRRALENLRQALDRKD